MSSKLRFVLFSVAASLLSFSAGCTDVGTPVDARPTSTDAQSASRRPTAGAAFASSGSFDIIARFRKKPQVTIAWAKAWIGPAGGRVDFQGFTIIVPEGAVDKVTMFTIRLPVDPNGSERVVAEFGPHNVPFARPVTIGFPIRGTSIDGDPAARVVWWNEGWVDMGGAVSADGSQIFTETPHFSEYGTTASRGGTISLSGG